ncbi:MAG TPA: alpha/beta hydrolase [Thermoanaerobaculia bacterium]|nr:alpha/beta hydrolase [Thermoanaerobaculia bacterium]
MTGAEGSSLAFRSSGTGRPIVWIHGFPLSSELFSFQFSIRDARHIAPDLRGFGETPAPAGAVSMADHAADVLSLLDRLGIESAVMAGVSMGGYVLFEILRRAPERVEALILCDTRETADSAEAKKGRLDMIEQVRSEGVGPIVDSMLPKMLTEETLQAADERVRLVKRIMEAASPQGVIAALEAMAMRPDSTDVLRGCGIPAAILAGDHDLVTPPADAARMTSLLPNASLHLIQRAAHLANVERHDEVNRVISAFLDTIPGTATSD